MRIRPAQNTRVRALLCGERYKLSRKTMSGKNVFGRNRSEDSLRKKSRAELYRFSVLFNGSDV
jgi:translation initiation factor 2B subunit (eIF-2B alpha/beta/delta family)